MKKQFRTLFDRPLGGVVSLNDVFPQHAVSGDHNFWEYDDTDAQLTEWFGNRPYSLIDAQIFVSPNTGQAGYLSVLVDNLIHERMQQVEKYQAGSGAQKHPDTTVEIDQLKKAQAVILNCAPRSKQTTQDGEDNGREFYCAITENNVEVYVTPLSHLSALDARHRIIALYRIPNRDNPEYGNGEQFRSRLITRTRRWPETYETVFEYKDRAALIAAKKSGAHDMSLIPASTDDKIDFVDRFGNIRLEMHDQDALQELFSSAGTGGKIEITVGEGQKQASFEAVITTSMREAPYRELAIYTNNADPIDPSLQGSMKVPIYAELIVQEDVSILDHMSAAKVIHEKYPHFLQAPVQLRAL